MKVSTNKVNLFVALFLTCGSLAYGGDPTPLWPTGQFNVTKLLNAPKAVYHGFKASGDHLYFLFSTGPTTDNSSLVETDLDGNLVRLTSLGRSPILDFSVGSTGEVEVLQLPPVGDAIWRSLAIDGDQPNGGAPVPSKMPQALIGDFCINAMGSVSKLKQAGSLGTFGPDVSHPFALYGLVTSNLLAQIDANSGVLRMVDVETGSFSKVELHNEYLDNALALYSNIPANGLVITSAVGDGSGHLFLLVSGYNVKKGPTILILNRHGDVVAVVAAYLIKRGYKTPIPAGMAVTKNQLLILSEDGVISKFDLTLEGLN